MFFLMLAKQTTAAVLTLYVILSLFKVAAVTTEDFEWVAWAEKFIVLFKKKKFSLQVVIGTHGDNFSS